MTPVKITIATTYRNAGEEERSVQTYGGRRYEKDGAAVLRYEESFSEDGESVMTTMYVWDEEVRLHRKGSFGGDMVFKAGLPCEFFYRTGFGNLPMEIHTHEVAVEKGDGRLSVKLAYTLFAGDEAISETEMEISVENIL